LFAAFFAENFLRISAVTPPAEVALLVTTANVAMHAGHMTSLQPLVMSGEWLVISTRWPKYRAAAAVCRTPGCPRVVPKSGRRGGTDDRTILERKEVP
jgi:hypothetical protein